MHILMISDVYFPRINGVSTSVNILRQELDAAGHHSTLIIPHYDGSRETSFDPSSSTWRIPAHRIPFDPEDRLFRGRPLKACLKQLDADVFDVVHIHTPFAAHRYGVPWARRRAIPVLETYHTFFEEYFFHYIPFLPRALLRLLARRLTVGQCRVLDQLVAPSRPMLDVLRNYGVDCPAQVIPTGIEIEKFQRGDGAAFRARHGIEPERPVLIHIGRVAFEKNIGFLLRVLERVRKDIPDILLLIAGEGPARPALFKEVRNSGLQENVRFIGYLDRETELINCYCAGDLFVFSSRTETQGLVLLEAMATGLPVVSTAVMGTKDVLVDGEGCRIAREDVEDYSAKVSALLCDRVAREALSRSAKRYAQRWSAGAMANRMVEFYEDAISIYHDSSEMESLSRI